MSNMLTAGYDILSKIAYYLDPVSLNHLLSTCKALKGNKDKIDREKSIDLFINPPTDSLPLVFPSSCSELSEGLKRGIWQFYYICKYDYAFLVNKYAFVLTFKPIHLDMLDAAIRFKSKNVLKLLVNVIKKKNIKFPKYNSEDKEYECNDLLVSTLHNGLSYRDDFITSQIFSLPKIYSPIILRAIIMMDMVEEFSEKITFKGFPKDLLLEECCACLSKKSFVYLIRKKHTSMSSYMSLFPIVFEMKYADERKIEFLDYVERELVPKEKTKKFYELFILVSSFSLLAWKWILPKIETEDQTLYYKSALSAACECEDDGTFQEILSLLEKKSGLNIGEKLAGIGSDKLSLEDNTKLTRRFQPKRKRES